MSRRALWPRPSPGHRVSGQRRTTILNPLPLDDVRYLVAPRGTTAWVRNLRAAGEGELHLGRRVEPFTPVEVAGADKIPVLRAYLDRWGWEVGQFFEGVNSKATDEQLVEIAPGFPVFRLDDTNRERG